MTVIAFDGKTMAADKQGESGYIKTVRTKIRRLNGCLIGGAGTRHVVESVIAWLIAGAKPEQFPEPATKGEADILMVKPDGSIYLIQSGPHFTQLENRFFAIGCGADAAMAAMHLGYDAKHAVEVACIVNTGCGGGIDSLALVDGIR